MRNAVLMFTLIGLISHLSAQAPLNASLTGKSTYLRLGIEPGTMTAFGYQQNVDIGLFKEDVAAFAEWNVALFMFGPKNSELKIGGVHPIVVRGKFKVLNSFNLSVGSASNMHFDSYKFAVGDEVSGGLYGQSRYIATTLEYEKILLNRIEHSKFYRTTFYEDAEDGWYEGAGGRIQFGIESGRTIKDRIDLHLEIKFPLTEKFNNLGGSPLHINVGVGYRI